MVRILFNCVHFTRSENFEGLCETIFYFLPYCFRWSRFKLCSRPILLLRSSWWKKFTKKLTSCGFSVSLTSRAHSSVPFDQVIEMFINRYYKVIDGFSQITQNEVAIERWESTNHLLAALREHMNKNIRKNTYSSSKYLQNINIPKNDNDAATNAVVS